MIFLHLFFKLIIEFVSPTDSMIDLKKYINEMYKKYMCIMSYIITCSFHILYMLYYF
jgi:hypothetical protein